MRASCSASAMAERPPSEHFRLFVACELPDEVRDALAATEDDLRSALGGRLRWVRPQGIHITLKFLGEVETSRLEAIRSALEGAVSPFELRVRPAALGGFGGDRLRVVWIGLEGDTEGLARLAAGVDVALAPLGFARERRPLAAHLTLARVPDEMPVPERREVARLVESYHPRPMPSMTLTHVALMRSMLARGGAVYERLAVFPGG